MNEKMVFGMYAIAVVAILQGIAWLVNFNGAVFAFTALCIGSIVGAVLGFEWGLKRAS